MLKLFKLLCLSGCLSIGAQLFADNQSNPAEASNALPTTLALPGQPVYQLKTIYCPKPSELVKDNQTTQWSALGGTWQSADRSLVTKVTTFLGAQWQGINLGQPFCVYHGEPAGTFDVVLAYHTFSITPRSGQWKTGQGQHIYKCFSHRVADCMFQVRLQPKQLTIDQQLAQIQPGNHDDETGSEGF